MAIFRAKSVWKRPQHGNAPKHSLFDRSRRAAQKRDLEAEIFKLVLAVVLGLLIFLIWFEGPARERYQILVYVALPVCIVHPILTTVI